MFLHSKKENWEKVFHNQKWQFMRQVLGVHTRLANPVAVTNIILSDNTGKKRVKLFQNEWLVLQMCAQ